MSLSFPPAAQPDGIPALLSCILRLRWLGEKRKRGRFMQDKQARLTLLLIGERNMSDVSPSSRVSRRRRRPGTECTEHIVQKISRRGEKEKRHLPQRKKCGRTSGSIFHAFSSHTNSFPPFFFFFGGRSDVRTYVDGGCCRAHRGRNGASKRGNFLPSAHFSPILLI